MKFLVALALAACVAAAPATNARARLERRLARRAGSSHPVQKIPTSQIHPDGTPTKNEQYSSNWAGVVIPNPPSGTFTAVSATFTVPAPQTTGGGSTQSASAWVGIDGDTCGSAILQTGVDFNVDGDGNVSYDSWYEWFPDYAYSFSGISFNTGDTVALSVVSSSSTSGTAVIQNLSNGQQVSQYITSSSALCGQNAEWIVEDFEEGGGLVPFCNFGTVSFYNANAQTSDGGNYAADIGGLIDISQNGQTLTQSSQPGGGVVTVQYV